MKQQLEYVRVELSEAYMGFATPFALLNVFFFNWSCLIILAVWVEQLKTLTFGVKLMLRDKSGWLLMLELLMGLIILGSQ